MKTNLVILAIVLSLFLVGGLMLQAAKAQDSACVTLQKSLDQYDKLFSAGQTKDDQTIKAAVQVAADQWRETIRLLADANLYLLETFVGFMNNVDKFLKASKASDEAMKDKFGNAFKAKFDEMKQQCPDLTFVPPFTGTPAPMIGPSRKGPQPQPQPRGGWNTR